MKTRKIIAKAYVKKLELRLVWLDGMGWSQGKNEIRDIAEKILRQIIKKVEENEEDHN